MNKLLFIALAIVLALVPAGTLFAQEMDTGTVYCGDLAQEDCDLLNESQAAMQELTAAASVFEFDVDLGSLLSLPVEDGVLGYSQATRFNVEPEVLAAMQSVSQMDADELAAAFSDDQAYTDFVMQLVLNTDLEQTFSLGVSDEVAGIFSAELEIELPSSLTLQYVLVDGMLYLQVEELATLVPALGFLQGWVGFDLPSAIALFAKDGTLTAPDNFEDFQSGMIVPGMAMTGMGMLGEEREEAMFGQHKTVTHVDDGLIDGQPVAVYSTTLDLVSLLADSDVQTWLIEVLGEDLMSSLGMTKDNLGVLPTILAVAGPTLFSELNYEILQSIGTEDAYLYRNEVLFNWDLSRLRSMVGAENDKANPVVMDVTSTNNNSEFNEAVVTPPADATILPVAMIVQLLGMTQQ